MHFHPTHFRSRNDHPIVILVLEIIVIKNAIFCVFTLQIPFPEFRVFVQNSDGIPSVPQNTEFRPTLRWRLYLINFQFMTKQKYFSMFKKPIFQ